MVNIIKKGIVLALVAQLAYVGFSAVAVPKQCQSCVKQEDGTYKCSGCVD